jgi:hypothetical protein
VDITEFLMAMQQWHPEILEAANVGISDAATIVFIKVSKHVRFKEDPAGYLSIEEALADLYMFI